MLKVVVLIFVAVALCSALMPDYPIEHFCKTSLSVQKIAITATNCELDKAGAIVTRWYFYTQNDFSGTAYTKTSFITDGGIIGSEALWVEDQPMPQVGDTALVFFETIDDELHVNGMVLGYLKISGNCISGFDLSSFETYLQKILAGKISEKPQPCAQNSAQTEKLEPSATITGFSPSAGISGDGTVEFVITGDGFGSTPGTVQFTYYQWSGYTPTYLDASFTTINSWRDMEIRTDVPPHASSGPVKVTLPGGSSAETPTSFYVTFGYNSNHWHFATPTTVTLTHNDATYPVAGAGTAIQNAVATWNAAHAQFNFIWGGTTTDGDAAYDGSANGNCAMHFGTFPTSSPPLGQCRTRMTSVPLGWEIYEMDIRFNVLESWSAGDPITANDVQSCALHELGHGLQLLDLYGISDNGKIMYGVLTTGYPMRTLHTQDIAGINYIYGALDVAESSENFSENIRIFPNPVGNCMSLNLNLPHAGNYTAQIFSIDGKLHSAKELSATKAGDCTFELDFSALAKGAYFATITGHGFSKKVKFIK